MYEVALVFSTVSFIAILAIYIKHPSFNIYNPLTFYCAFHAFIFIVRPAIAFYMGFDRVYLYYQFNPSDSDKITVIYASNLGFIFFAICCMLASRCKMSFKSDAVTLAERRKLKPLFFVACLFCVPIGVYSLATAWSSAATTGEAFSGMVRDAASRITINVNTNGYFVEAQLMLATCAAIIAWLFRFRLLSLVPILTFVVFRAGTGGRGPFVTALASIGLIYLYDRRRTFPHVWTFALVPALLLIFQLVGDDRGAAIRSFVGGDSGSQIFKKNRATERPLEGMDFANMEFFEYAVYVVPQRSGTYSYFTGTLQILTEPIPRVLWKNKPIGPPIQRINMFDYGNPIGMSGSLPGEGWISFGWLGVIIWCGGWGYALGTIYRKYVESEQSTLQTVMYMTFIPILIVAYRDGSIVTIARQGIFFFAPIYLWWAIARFMRVPSLKNVRLARARDKGGSATHRTSVQENELKPVPAAVQRRRAALSKEAR